PLEDKGEQREEEGFVGSRQAGWKLAIAAVALAGCVAFQIRAARLEMHSQAGPDVYRGGVEWLRAHVPENEMLFNVDWADFPKLYYYDPERAYVAGLDPMYLADANAELGRLYAQIAAGQASDPGA